MAKKRKSEIAVTASSGNVFTDLGFPEPVEELTKAQLASHIRQIISQRRLSQRAAASLMGGQDVDITVKAKPRHRAHGRIRVIGEAA